jgi:hypothetical protein
MSKKSDITDMAQTLKGMRGPFSLKKVSGKLEGWTEERITDALDALEEKTVIAFMGNSGTHFSVDKEALEAFIVGEENGVFEKGSKKKVVLVCPKIPAPPKRKCPSINDIMSQLEEVSAPEVYEGDERENKIAELFELAKNKINEINEAILAIAKKFPMYVSAEDDLLSIVRVTPDKGSTAPGGVRVTYTPPHTYRRKASLFESPWPRYLTDENGLRVVMRMERVAVKLLEKMTDYVLKHAVKTVKPTVIEEK